MNVTEDKGGSDESDRIVETYLLVRYIIIPTYRALGIPSLRFSFVLTNQNQTNILFVCLLIIGSLHELPFFRRLSKVSHFFYLPYSLHLSLTDRGANFGEKNFGSALVVIAVIIFLQQKLMKKVLYRSLGKYFILCQ